MNWKSTVDDVVGFIAQRYRTLSSTGRAIALGLAILLLALLIFVILQPVRDYSKHARAALDREQQLLLTLEHNADDIRRLSAKRKAKTGNDTSLLALASKTATEYQLTLQRYEPGADGRLSIWLSNANFNTLLAWLEQLEHQYQVHIDRISVTAANTPGQVEAQVQLRE